MASGTKIWYKLIIFGYTLRIHCGTAVLKSADVCFIDTLSGKAIENRILLTKFSDIFKWFSIKKKTKLITNVSKCFGFFFPEGHTNN